MGPRTQTPQTLDAPHFQPGLGPDPEPCQGQPPPGGKVLELGRLFVKTVRHFWPQFNDWLETLPDTRFVPMVEYDRRFLLWWGLLLFCFKLGSRRRLDGLPLLCPAPLPTLFSPQKRFFHLLSPPRPRG